MEIMHDCFILYAVINDMFVDFLKYILMKNYMELPFESNSIFVSVLYIVLCMCLNSIIIIFCLFIYLYSSLKQNVYKIIHRTCFNQ